MGNAYSRRGFLQTTAAGAALAPLGASRIHARPADREAARAAAASEKPNLVFVLADQWRSSAFGHGSDEVVRTPQIDALARDGCIWSHAFAANPVCTPNRSCLLTGRYSHQTGMIQNNLMLPPDEICWPEIFRDAGYQTHYIGKWHMDGPEKPGFVPPGWRRRGFQTFEGFNRGHVYHKHWGFDDAGNELPWQKGGDPYYEPTLQTDLAIDFIRENREQPFACYLSWGPPHTPFNPPEAFRKYTPQEIRLRPNVPAAHRQRAIRDLTGYYGLCESLDHEMGRLLRAIDEMELRDKTLVVMTADHGELAGSHGKYRKGEPEDESLRVPLIMRLPGVIRQQVNSTLINSIDVMPTMLSLCGLPVPETCTGRNRADTLHSATAANHSVYCEGKVVAGQPADGARRRNQAVNTWRSLVTSRYKLSVRGSWDNVEALIDRQNDPFEMENLAADPKHRSTRSELLEEMRDWARRTGDVFPHIPTSAQATYTDEEAAAAR